MNTSVPSFDRSALHLVDTHCHLDFHAFDEDRPQVMERARQAGICRIVNPAVDLETARSAIHLSETYPEIYAAVGFHPNDLSAWSNEALSLMESLAQHPRVVAIGEIGLDYYRQHTAPQIQQRVFQQQLDLAARVGKPVIIHSREATAATLAKLEAWRTVWHHSLASDRARPPGVLHSFSGDADAARKAIELGFFIGITGPVTFLNARNLQSLVKSLPLENLLIETDAPFLAPHPLRGQRNEPAHVRRVAEKIAELKGLPVETVGKITTRNAARLFGWEE